MDKPWTRREYATQPLYFNDQYDAYVFGFNQAKQSNAETRSEASGGPGIYEDESGRRFMLQDAEWYVYGDPYGSGHLGWYRIPDMNPEILKTVENRINQNN